MTEFPEPALGQDQLLLVPGQRSVEGQLGFVHVPLLLPQPLAQQALEVFVTLVGTR